MCGQVGYASWEARAIFRGNVDRPLVYLNRFLKLVAISHVKSEIGEGNRFPLLVVVLLMELNGPAEGFLAVVISPGVPREETNPVVDVGGVDAGDGLAALE